MLSKPLHVASLELNLNYGAIIIAVTLFAAIPQMCGAITVYIFVPGLHVHLHT